MPGALPSDNLADLQCVKLSQQEKVEADMSKKAGNIGCARSTHTHTRETCMHFHIDPCACHVHTHAHLHCIFFFGQALVLGDDPFRSFVSQCRREVGSA